MNIAEIMRDANTLKVAFTVEGRNIRLEGEMPDELIEQVRANKQALLEYLSSPRPTVSCLHGVKTVYDRVAYENYLAMQARSEFRLGDGEQ